MNKEEIIKFIQEYLIFRKPKNYYDQLELICMIPDIMASWSQHFGMPNAEHMRVFIKNNYREIIYREIIDTLPPKDY